MNGVYEVLGLLVVAVVAGLGAYWGSYFKTKGKNVATQDDIAELTTTTKRIEAEISGDLWNRQKKWELKKEVLIGTMKGLRRVDQSLRDLKTVFDVAKGEKDEGEAWTQRKGEALKEFNEASGLFDEMAMLVDVTCSTKTVQACKNLRLLMQQLAFAIGHEDEKAIREIQNKLNLFFTLVELAVRDELGIEPLAKPQSNESSAAEVSRA